MSEKAIGAHVRCRASGIVGKIIARTEWAWRSAEVAVLRDGCDADGKPFDLLWMDEGRVEITSGETGNG